MHSTDWTTRENRHRQLGLAGVALVHALIAAAWLASGKLARPPRLEVERIQWLWLREPVRVPRPEAVQVPRSEPVHEPMHERKPHAAPPQQVRTAPQQVRTAPVQPDHPASTAADAMPVPSAVDPAPVAPAEGADAGPVDLATRARQMAGSVDKELRRESHKPLELVDTPYKRFVAALEAAHVRKFSGIATFTDITVPGTGQRLVKVSYGAFSYCLTMPSIGMRIDEYQAARSAKIVNCP